MADTAKCAKEIRYSYFYGQESEQFTFLRIPKTIFMEEPFLSLSWEARILYSMMLDRMGLSQKNGWFDEKNRVYIIFTLEEVQKVLNCGRDKGIVRKKNEKGVPAMKMVLKILCAPIVAILALFIWLATQLIKVSAVVMNFIAIALALGAVCILLDGRTGQGIAGLAAAFLMTPFGLPLLAIILLGQVQRFKCWIQDMVYA